MAKARTKIEKKLVQWAGKLPALTNEHLSWAKENMFEDVGYFKYKAREMWCQVCGNMEPFLPEESPSTLIAMFQMEGYVCPCCGTELKVKQYMKKDEYTPNYIGQTCGNLFCICTTYRGWQVIRGVEACRWNEKPGAQTDYYLRECFQIWISDKGKEVIVTKKYGHNISGFTYWEGSSTIWGIGHHNENAYSNYYCYDSFDIGRYKMYPKMSVIEKLRKHGWNAKLKRFLERRDYTNYANVFKRLLTHDKSEWLVKTGQLPMFWLMLRNGDRVIRYEHSVKICVRNHYIIKDVSIWEDLMDALSYFHKDTHNAHYVCPSDLMKAHDEWVGRKEKKEKQEEEARQWQEKMEQMKRDEEARKMYDDERSEFKKLSFGDGTITFHVLQDVEEFAEEGQAMKHCVFANRYYDLKRHPDSLILSARDADNKRVETVEINIKTFDVIQSRGKCNQDTALHPLILKLLKKYMPLVRKTAQAQNLKKITHGGENKEFKRVGLGETCEWQKPNVQKLPILSESSND